MAMRDKAGLKNGKVAWHLRLARSAYENRRRGATAGAVALALVLGYHVVFGQNGLAVLDQKRQLSHSLAADITGLQTENAQLKDHVGRLANDPNAIEHEAREQLHYTRPGEVIYTLPGAPAQSANQGNKR